MILKNALFLITMDKNGTIIKDGAVYIEGNKIVNIGKTEEIVKEYKDDEVIDCKGKLVMPGLINTHTHAPMVLFRGLGEDMELMEWLETKIWPMEAKLKPKDVYIGALLACIEMIKNGITCFADMYFFMDQVAKACLEVGIRGVLAWAVLDREISTKMDTSIEGCEKFVKRWTNKFDLIIPFVGPHAIYTCSMDTLLKARDIANKYNTYLHIHLSETRKEVYDCWKKYKKRPVEYLKSIEFLGENVLAAHCGWLTKSEVKILAEHNTKVSHCPVSNMKLATGGVMPLPEMQKAGVTIGLGTDGAASNNSLDLFETMKFAALLHKHARWDPTVTKAYDIVKMATIDGAKCLGIEEKIGSLETGKTADIIILDVEKPYWKPCYNPIFNLVYSCKASDVETVIVNGKIIVKNKKLTTVDEEKIMEVVEKWVIK